MDNKPSITVVLPVYNGGAYLIESVQSVLDQTLHNFEFIILDDCSTDDSYRYLQSLQDARIRLYKNEKNKGLFYNLNFMIKNASGPLIKLWSQDDIMYPGCLAVFVDFHKQHPGLGFSYCGRAVIDASGKIHANNRVDHTPSIINPRLHARIAFFTGSIAGNIANTCIDKKAMDKVGLFREDMKISADFDMWVRLAKDHDTGFIPDKLIQQRDHDGQLSRNEHFFINHLKEDMQVYKNLFSYVSATQMKEGKILLRNNKFVFYYTLMMKEFFKGRFKNGISFARILFGADNFLLLSVSFLKKKLGFNKSTLNLDAPL